MSENPSPYSMRLAAAFFVCLAAQVTHASAAERAVRARDFAAAFEAEAAERASDDPAVHALAEQIFCCGSQGHESPKDCAARCFKFALAFYKVNPDEVREAEAKREAANKAAFEKTRQS